MSVRWFIICLPEERDLKPWVLAETPDEGWARDMALVWHDNVVLSREEALLDPDFREAALAWDAKDDRNCAAEFVLEEAEAQMSPIFEDDLLPAPPPPTQEQVEYMMRHSAGRHWEAILRGTKAGGELLEALVDLDFELGRSSPYLTKRLDREGRQRVFRFIAREAANRGDVLG